MAFVNQQTLCETVFGLPFPPNKEELEIQYRKLVKILHPDKGGNHTDFVRMNDAYRVLKPIAETTKKAQGLGFIQGRPLTDLGQGFSPPMPTCTECEGMGYLLNVKQVLETYRQCPDCAFPIRLNFTCQRCHDRGTIKLVQVAQANLICKECEGQGQIYISNPVLRVNGVV